jgi:hypothetical protein
MDDAEPFETIWAPQQVGVTVLVTLPSVLVSAAVSGVLLSIVVPVAVSLLVAAAVAVVVVLVRVVWWARYLAGREVVVSDTCLAVRCGDRVLGRVLWSDVDSVRLVRGDGLLRVMVDVTADATDFPHIAATSSGVWDVGRTLPSVLALLPQEVGRLESAIDEVCTARSVSFSVSR